MFCMVYIRDRKGSARMIYIYFVWYTFGSEGECPYDIRLFCVVYIRGRKGSARIIYIYFFLVYIRGRKKNARIIYALSCVIYIRDWKENARMIYVCFVWDTFGVGRRVLEWYTYVLFGKHSGSEEECSNDIRMFFFVWYTFENMNGWYLYIVMYDEQYGYMIGVSLIVLLIYDDT